MIRLNNPIGYGSWESEKSKEWLKNGFWVSGLYMNHGYTCSYFFWPCNWKTPKSVFVFLSLVSIPLFSNFRSKALLPHDNWWNALFFFFCTKAWETFHINYLPQEEYEALILILSLVHSWPSKISLIDLERTQVR